MKKGFTLVELSIVLVIIGLLIGGILAAQTMIESAKVNSQVRQFQQYDIAVTQFREKFKQLPGDSNLFPSTGYAGNNDKNIDGGDYYGAAASNMGSPSEAANFWRHMSASGSIQQVFGTADPNNITAGIDAPAAKMGVKGSLIQGMSLRTAGYGVNIPWGEYWVLCTNGTTTRPDRFCLNYGNGTGALTGMQALAIDTKIDDGIPASGIVIGGGEPGFYDSDTTYGNYGINCASGDIATPSATSYNTSLTSPECMLHVKMFGFQNGQDS